MSYPMEWHGSKDQAIKSGVVVFKVDGRDYSIQLPSFSDAMEISKMLDKSFEQGKDFAFHCIKHGVITSFDRLDQAHSLSLPQ